LERPFNPTLRMIFDADRDMSYRSGAIVILMCLLPLQAGAQEIASPNPRASTNLETSVRGPLQRRLQAAFPDSFQTGIEIFWELSDGWTSPEVFDWWASHVSDEDIASVTPETAGRMFSVLSEQSQVFRSARRRDICAVVGASGNLLDSRYGELIDAHNVVFRMNRAPTDVFDDDVGERTTHHVMWPRLLDEQHFDRRAFLLMSPITTDTEDVFDRILSLVENDLRWDPGHVRIIHPEFVKYLQENWTQGVSSYPSTGFITLMIAVHICDEVDVFGFGADADGNWDHYYNNEVVKASGFHPGGLEAQLRREMAEKGILHVYPGVRPDPEEASPGD